MANYKYTSKYERTTEYIFATAAKRLKERKLSLNLTDSKIAGDYDRKVISRIFNNKRTQNNIYLIPPAYVELLVRELGFDDSCQLFWGNAEDELYVKELFCNLLLDISFGKNSDIVNNVLIDDVAYAKISVTSDLIEYEDQEGEYLPYSPIAHVNNEKQFTFDECIKLQDNAILRLYKNTRPKQMFKDFFEEKNNHGENKGFSKLEKRLDEFVNKSLMPFLKENMPGANSLGLRAYSIIKTDIAEYVEMETLNDYMASDSEYEGVDNPFHLECYEVLQLLTSAGKAYIEQIEKVQGRLDELHREVKEAGEGC